MKNDGINEYSIIGDSNIHDSAEINYGTIIGKTYRRYLDGTREDIKKTLISENVYIGFYSIIGNGSVISENVIIDDFCIVESNVHIDSSTLVTYRAHVCNEVSIGTNCVIGGFIGERTKIGDNCRVFGSIVHSHNKPFLGWDDDEAMEDAPVIENSVIIGFNAQIIGGVKIEKKVYVCAGAIVTKDVPAFHIACGNNNFVHYLNWPGSLRNSDHFKEIS